MSTNPMLDAELEAAEEDTSTPESNLEAPKRRHFDVKSLQFHNHVKTLIRAKKADWCRNLVYLDGSKFDFAGRDYLFPIYNGRFPRLLLKFSRQCEKCLSASSIVTKHDGTPVRARNIKEGDVLPGWDFGTGRKIPVRVVASESNGVRECLEIKVSGDWLLEVTGNHPIHTPNGWTAAKDLKVGDQVSCVREELYIGNVTSIRPIGQVETWAIQTENGTYIADNVLQHNSTFLANNLIVDSAVIPYCKSVYVSPSYLQTRQFSAGKLTPWMEDSPTISKYLLSSKVSSQVFEKGLTNGSMIFLRSAFLNADRVRGLSANTLALDEIQNFISANIPVIMEVLSHAHDPTAIFAGTPLTNDNILEQVWQESSQCEWLVKCHRHSPVHLNFLDERCIGKEGPICNACGKLINPSDGTWVAFSNQRDTMGFHLNQIMVPWMQSPSKWKEIIWKLETYSKGQFYNEVLGISFDSASKPVTRTDLMAACSKERRMVTYPTDETRVYSTVMGVDWGTGSDGSERDEKGRLRTASYTIVCIGAYIAPGKFHPFFYRRYKGDDAIPTNCIKDIIALARLFNVSLIGADWGFGWAANDQLESAFGPHKVIKYQYVGIQRERMKYDPVAHKMVVSRTEVMSDFFADIKKGRYLFPIWEQSEEFLVDIEHIFAEVGTLGQLKYDHKKTEPDDAAHATIFAKAGRVFLS